MSDGTIVEIPYNTSHDSGYEEKSAPETPQKRSSHPSLQVTPVISKTTDACTIREKVDKSSLRSYPDTPYPRSNTDLRKLSELTPDHQPSRSSPPTYRTFRKSRSALKPDPTKPSPQLSLTFDESTSAFSKCQSSHSDDSFCDCNFCIQNSTTVEESSDCSSSSCRYPVQNLLSVFRSESAPQDTDTSTNTSVVSFNYQDDILASSPMGHNGDDSCLSEVTSLLLQSTKTPKEMGFKRDDLSDSLAVLGTNSHTKIVDQNGFIDD